MGRQRFFWSRRSAIQDGSLQLVNQSTAALKTKCAGFARDGERVAGALVFTAFASRGRFQNCLWRLLVSHLATSVFAGPR